MLPNLTSHSYIISILSQIVIIYFPYKSFGVLQILIIELNNEMEKLRVISVPFLVNKTFPFVVLQTIYFMLTRCFSSVFPQLFYPPYHTIGKVMLCNWVLIIIYDMMTISVFCYNKCWYILLLVALLPLYYCLYHSLSLFRYIIL